MPYMPNHLGVTGFVIVEPGGDRPYFCHKLPLEYVQQASTRGGRVFAFELELIKGSVPSVREIDVTRAKTIADLVATLGQRNVFLPYEYSVHEVEHLQARRQEALADAAEKLLIVEAINRRLLGCAALPRSHAATPHTEAASAIALLPWRGSVTDLATDIRGELSEREVNELVAALKEPKRGGGDV